MSIEDARIGLRPTTHRDTEFAWLLYRDLMQPLHEELSDWDEALQRRFIENDLLSGEVSIVMIEGQAAGWIHVRETAQRIGILQLYLKPRFQNRYIGTMLIRRLIHRAWMTKRELFLEVIRNSRSRRLYERLGFIATGEVGQKLRMSLQRGTAPQGPVLPRPPALRVAAEPAAPSSCGGKG